ncbi:MAG: GFA family protein, partial [Sandarakinorhabdus sp.]|nr:GFA family protein [Sandarakinorhabdus sp.]
MIASCQCGAVTVTVDDHVAITDVNICHCHACQRRSGSPFGMIAWVPAAAVTLRGKTTVFTRKADSGRDFTSRFCPACGSSMLFEAPLKPGVIGIAAGAFADPDFPPPVRSVWEESR